MLVTAQLDLSESDAVQNAPTPPSTVLIYPTPDADLGALTYDDRLAGALEAIGRCRLIAEGHVFKIEVLPSVVHPLGRPRAFHLPATGTEIVRTVES